MLFDELAEPSRTLVRARSRAFGNSLTDLAREYSSLSSVELADALHQAPRDQKAQIGLLLARVALEEALNTRSRELFGRFLFRFAAHLKASVSLPGLSAAQRLSLAMASEKTFEVVPGSSATQRAEAASVRSRLASATATDDDWRKTVGFSKADFFAIVDQFDRELGGRRNSRTKMPAVSRSNAARPKPVNLIDEHPLPVWLTIDFNPSPDSLVGSTANWRPSGKEPAGKSSLSHAWSAFKEGEYATARLAILPVTEKLSSNWGPTSSADALRSWNWLRLVVELAALQTNSVTDARRSWTSVCVFLQKCLPHEFDLIEGFIENAIGGLVAGDIASRRALSAYATRLVVELGHEVALASYSNTEKAGLRGIWATQHDLASDESRSTNSAASSVASQLRQATQKLYVGARDGSSPSRVLRDASHHIVTFLDEAEGELFGEALDLADEVERSVKLDGANHQELTDLIRAMRATMESIAESGSSILQDFLGPLVEVMSKRARDALVRLGDISRPELSVRLLTRRSPSAPQRARRSNFAFELRTRETQPRKLSHCRFCRRSWESTPSLGWTRSDLVPNPR